MGGRARQIRVAFSFTGTMAKCWRGLGMVSQRSPMGSGVLQKDMPAAGMHIEAGAVVLVPPA